MSDAHEKPSGPATSSGGESAVDPVALMQTRQYRVLLVFSALIGVVISLVSWLFLEVTNALQEWVYTSLPRSLGFTQEPWWWPLPPLLAAGFLIAIAVSKLPGDGGHDPSKGLTSKPPITPDKVAGVVLAAVATLGLGLVLGPEAPLLGLASGVTLFIVNRLRRPVPVQAKTILVSAGSFAALSAIFGSPIVGAIIIIEAAALGGATLPLVLLPGLVAAGIGSLAFVGIGSLTGLSSGAYALPPLTLPEYPTPQVTDFLWAIALSLAAAVVVFSLMGLGHRIRQTVAPRPFLMHPAAAILVGLLAIGFAELTGQSSSAVLFSGQKEMTATVQAASTASLGTLALLLVAKALAWALSMGAARGGPAFPAMFLGLAAGLFASQLLGLAETPAIGVLVGAALVVVLRLPLSAIILALLVTNAGAGVAPLIIVGVVVAYITRLLLAARWAQPPAALPA